MSATLGGVTPVVVAAEQRLREIEGLLETGRAESVRTETSGTRGAAQTQVAKWKKYARLALPHVALVLVVCLYAAAGAYVFYAIESPNEDRLKLLGRAAVVDQRERLVRDAFERARNGRTDYYGFELEIRQRLRAFNQLIYKSFKEQYVRYADVRHIGDGGRPRRLAYNMSISQGPDTPPRRLWTPGSALFFAATTMATIGYGNITPTTASGRLACVVFALFGAPLAIITIGDLGKFLSETTIWLYRAAKRAQRRMKRRCLRGKTRRKGRETDDKSGTQRSSLRTPSVSSRGDGKNKEMVPNGNAVDEEEDEGESSSDAEEKALDWETLVGDKTEVPVLLVFTILLLYIAFGGVLFALLEDWTYMDAFYFSFISLTTIGSPTGRFRFGDIVPDNHDYLGVMLLYLGVGLAVTTMCIDLVGITYIQKIHYFGRKFRGTDLLHLLKRKRLIERRLAMGHHDEILHLYIQQMTANIPDGVLVPFEEVKPRKLSNSAMRVEERMCAVADPVKWQMPVLHKIRRPTLLSVHSYALPSPAGDSLSSARSLMYACRLNRGDSWEPSGLSVPLVESPPSTPASVHARRAMYGEGRREVSPSANSFKFSFPPPSPDYGAIGAAARNARRVGSSPGALFAAMRALAAQPPSPLSARTRPSRAEPRDVPTGPLLLPPVATLQPPPPVALQQLAELSELLDWQETAGTRLELASQAGAVAAATHQQPLELDVARVETAPRPQLVPHLPLHLIGTAAAGSSLSTSSPAQTTGGRLPAIVEELPPDASLSARSEGAVAAAEAATSPRDPSVPRANQRRPSQPTGMDVEAVARAVGADLPRLFKELRARRDDLTNNNRQQQEESIVLVSPRNPIGLACMEDWDSYISMLDEYNKPYQRLGGATDELSCVEDGLSASCYDSCSELELEIGAAGPGGGAGGGLGDVDLGAFELVDSGVSAECLFKNDDPVLFQKTAAGTALPVHSVHHDTVHTEAALESLVTAPPQMLAGQVPPALVDHNYCFVVDGDKVEMSDIMGDENWWRHTSRPTRFFYSDDLRHFTRVHCITAKGRVIAARLIAAGGGGSSTHPNATAAAATHQAAHATHSALADLHQHRSSDAATTGLPSDRSNPDASSGQSWASWFSSSRPSTSRQSFATPRPSRPSISVGQSFAAAGGDNNKVSLDKVYKVTRFYSFWRTCTSFHRIVTMIDKVQAEGSNDRLTATDNDAENPPFRRRLFVQYLWRNAKVSDKARVFREFDPRRQRLLQFVNRSETAPLAQAHERSSRPSSVLSSASSGRRGKSSVVGTSTAPPTRSVSRQATLPNRRL